jgi:hypothetical protein
MSAWRATVGELLTRVGTTLPPPMTATVRRASDLIEVGRWMKASGYLVKKWAPSAEALWEKAAEDLADKRTLYLEFGVWRGYSMRFWAKLLKHAEARLQGFDSFEGLPEEWKSSQPKGAFDVGGRIPAIDDSRVELFKGWFDQILPNHSYPSHDRLFINFDADLYTSTKIALKSCENIILNGTYLYFDEFNEINHELAAFREFVAEHGMKMELVGATAGFVKVMFMRTD